MEEDEERFLLTESTSESECSRDSNGGPRDIGELLLTPPSQRREAAGEGEGEATDHTASPRYRLYRWRWLMLASLCLLNVSNGMMWLTFAPIPDQTAVFFGVSLADVDWFSISFFVVSLLVGFVAIYMLSSWGLRVPMYVGASCNLAGSVVRWFGTAYFLFCSPAFPRAGFMVAMVGQILTAFAQPFLLYSPTKLANLWFGPKERATCTSCASIANPIGLAVALLVSPYVVTTTSRISTLMWIYTIPAAVGLPLTLIAFSRKEPPLPPAPSAEGEKQPFFKGLKKVVTNVPFLVLLVAWGVGAGVFNALLTLLAQILCPHGYTNEQSGLWGALMIFSGLVGATIAGIIIDRTKMFKEVAVVAISLATICLTWFAEVSQLPNQPANAALSLCLFGFFALPLIPACMELGVETTYPVAEATSSGLLWSAVQVVGAVLVLVGGALQMPLSPAVLDRSACAASVQSNTPHLCLLTNSTLPSSSPPIPHDLTWAVLLFASLALIVLVLLAWGFRPTYRRLEAERRAALLTQLQQSSLYEGETSSVGGASVTRMGLESTRASRETVDGTGQEGAGLRTAREARTDSTVL